jgi:hypothetical protein
VVWQYNEIADERYFPLYCFITVFPEKGTKFLEYSAYAVLSLKRDFSKSKVELFFIETWESLCYTTLYSGMLLVCSPNASVMSFIRKNEI